MKRKISTAKIGEKIKARLKSNGLEITVYPHVTREYWVNAEDCTTTYFDDQLNFNI